MSRIVAALLFGGLPLVAAITPPTPPTASKIALMENDLTSLPRGPGCDVTVSNFVGLQNAIASATSGQSICLEASSTGAVFTGTLLLPAKANAQFITLKTKRYAELPEGIRVGPSDVGKLAKLVSGDREAGIAVAPGSTKYRFVGLWVEAATTNNVVLFRIGADGVWRSFTQKTLASFPSRTIIDRCYITGLPYPADSGIGVEINGNYTVVQNSTIVTHTGQGDGGSAIHFTTGTGLIVRNNYLESGGETIFAGGSDPAVLGANPSDVLVQGNVITDDDTKSVIDPHHHAKNRFELKTGVRWKIEGNIIGPHKNGWQSQFFPMVLKTANQGPPCNLGDTNDTGYYNQVADIEVAYNKFWNVDQFIAIGRTAACASTNPPGTQKIYIHDNLVTGLGYGHTADSHPKVYQWSYALDGEYTRSVVIEHNTVGPLYGSWGPSQIWHTYMEGSSIARDYAMNSNVFPGHFRVHGAEGGTAAESAVLTYFQPEFQFKNNLFITSKPGAFASNPNFYRNTYTGLFVDAAGGDYTLANPSQYPGHDGRPAGVDFAQLTKCTAGVSTGNWTGCSGAPLPGISVSLTANDSFGPIQVDSGAAVTLAWAVSNATSPCTASGSAAWTGSKSASGGTLVINPTANAMYLLTCTGASGSASASVVVNVNSSAIGCPDPPL